MDRLGDDVLFCIFIKLNEKRDQKSFHQVSKQLMKVACRRLRYLQSFVPHLLYDILPQSSNLVRFASFNKPLNNSHLKLLAQSCLKLSYLHLGYPVRNFERDFDDDGLCALANSCKNLRHVQVNYRLNFGDPGTMSLVRSCSKNLTTLVLSGCVKITDESLKVIGEECLYLQKLVLRGCSMITDLGLKYLVNGDLKYDLRILDLSRCDKISDDGIRCLTKIVKLDSLNLSRCGNHVTDSGIVDLLVSQQSNIWSLNLSGLMNISDMSLAVMGTKCLKLKYVYMNSCEAITSQGLHAFANHPTLQLLSLFSCHNLTWEDVKSVALSCSSLACLTLSSRLKTSKPADYVYEINHYYGGKMDGST
ncbi:uncharacterized protein [Rutidosis leptorrhynchoides]|uniref:uncharacterized protein n=1 Tax=Rutidosis leptorrhynchoides TaxID=125765 RepID=UPI003A998A5B